MTLSISDPPPIVSQIQNPKPLSQNPRSLPLTFSLPRFRTAMSSAPIGPSPPSVIKDRRLGFLIWQSISTASIYLLSSLLLLPLPLRRRQFSLSNFLLSFLALQAFLLLLSSSFLLLQSPAPVPAASLLELLTSLLKSAFKCIIGGFSGSVFAEDSGSRAWRSLKSIIFLVVCVVAGTFSVVSACWDSDEGAYALGMRGAVFGLVYGAHYLFRKRWILQFPVIQVFSSVPPCFLAPAVCVPERF